MSTLAIRWMGRPKPMTPASSSIGISNSVMSCLHPGTMLIAPNSVFRIDQSTLRTCAAVSGMIVGVMGPLPSGPLSLSSSPSFASSAPLPLPPSPPPSPSPLGASLRFRLSRSSASGSVSMPSSSPVLSPCLSRPAVSVAILASIIARVGIGSLGSSSGERVGVWLVFMEGVEGPVEAFAPFRFLLCPG